MLDARWTVARTRHAGALAASGLRCLLLLPLLLSGCEPGVLDPRGPVGGADRAILIDSLAIMLAIVVPTVLATLAFAVWYRAGNARARYRPDFAHSGRIELLVWTVPLLTITLLGGVTWLGAHELDPAVPLAGRAAPLEVQGVSLDWKWLFIYPEQHVASVNRLVLPAGRPVHFTLTSASVMNTFFVPQLGSMIYTMNHMTSQLYLQADAPGTFRGISGHYSGDGFSDMHFETRSLDAAGFASWAQAARTTGGVLDGGSYRALERQSMNVAPFTYRDVQPGLFAQVVSQALPPGPGPEMETAQGAPKQVEK